MGVEPGNGVGAGERGGFGYLHRLSSYLAILLRYLMGLCCVVCVVRPAINWINGIEMDRRYLQGQADLQGARRSATAICRGGGAIC